MTPIKVMIVDDHGVMRAGLKALISAQSDMVVVGEARDGEEAVAKAVEVSPDVAVVDLELPRMGGIQVIQEILKRCPETRMLALTMHDDQSFVKDVIAAGGTGYVVKDALGDELMVAIRAVHQGRTYINVSISGKGAGGLLDDGSEGEAEQPGGAIKSLSDRELQVLELLAQGFTNQQIGKLLHLSPKTIGTYRFRISSKLGLDTRADIVRFALETGILKTTKDV